MEDFARAYDAETTSVDEATTPRAEDLPGFCDLVDGAPPLEPDLDVRLGSSWVPLDGRASEFAGGGGGGNEGGDEGGDGENKNENGGGRDSVSESARGNGRGEAGPAPKMKRIPRRFRALSVVMSGVRVGFGV